MKACSLSRRVAFQNSREHKNGTLYNIAKKNRLGKNRLTSFE